jgi:hypothetical protein
MDTATRRIGTVLTSLSADGHKEGLRVYQFAPLIIYGPVYAADSLKYFDNEGFKIAGTYVNAANDDEVARQLANADTTYAIGLCDPIAVLVHNDTVPNRPLKIICPLVVRNAVTAATNKLEIATTDLHRLSRTITLATYRRPSTTYYESLRAKNALLSAPDAISIGRGQIDVCELENGVDFRSGSSLQDALSKYDLCMLWEPHLSISQKKFGAVPHPISTDTALSDRFYSCIVAKAAVVDDMPDFPRRVLRAVSHGILALSLERTRTRALSGLNNSLGSMQHLSAGGVLEEMVSRAAQDGVWPDLDAHKSIPEVGWTSSIHNEIANRAEVLRSMVDDSSITKKVRSEARNILEQVLSNYSSGQDCRHHFFADTVG